MSDRQQDETCQHHGDQVAISMTEVEIEDEDELEEFCDWCGGLPDLVLVKSQRHRIIFCEECRDVIRALVRDQ